jgi:hypothetical protein
MRRMRDFMPATLSVGQRQMETIVAATSKDVAWLLPRDAHDPTPRLLPRPAQIAFSHQGQLVVLRGTAERAAQGTVAFAADREGRVDNLRSTPRLDVALKARVTLPGGEPQDAMTANLSAGGVLLDGQELGRRGDELHVAIELPQEAVVASPARIVRVDERGTGAVFLDLDREQRDLLESMVLSVRAALARRFASR